MIYLDHGATSFPKLPQVRRAACRAMACCANPGRGGHRPAVHAMETVYSTRERAAALFDCDPEQVAFTGSCTQGLNIAIRSLVKPGDRVVVSGFEHNAVMRLLYALGADVIVAGRKLFDWGDTLSCFRDALQQGVRAAVFTHISNVFGYVLPVEAMAGLCHQYGVPFIIDVAQSAGIYPVHLNQWKADFVAMPGHKGLLGPQGTGILLCGREAQPLVYGGTGSESRNRDMPEFLPDRLEAGTVNVPGIAGLGAGLEYLEQKGIHRIRSAECREAKRCGVGLETLGFRVFSGQHQSGTVSFLPEGDCEEVAASLAKRGIAVRAGLHCAPLAHESAGTLETGTVRISFGHDACPEQTNHLLRALQDIRRGGG